MMSPMTRFVALFTGGILLMSAGDVAAQPAAKPQAREAAASVAQPLSTARGVIKAVSDRRLVLDGMPRGAGPDTLGLDEKTVFERLRKTLTVKDLKVGDPVTVSYAVKDGKPVATRVWVRPARGGSHMPANKPR